MLVVQIIGPYRGRTWFERQRNIRKARVLAKRLWGMGCAVICPHTNTSNFDGCADDEIFLQGYLELIRRRVPDVLVAMKGWALSSGSHAEVQVGIEMRIPVLYDNEVDRLELYRRELEDGVSGGEVT